MHNSVSLYHNFVKNASQFALADKLVSEHIFHKASNFGTIYFKEEYVFGLFTLVVFAS